MSTRKQQFITSTLTGNPAGEGASELPIRLAFSELKSLAESYAKCRGVSIHMAGEVLPQLLADWHGHLADTWNAQAMEMLMAPDSGMRALEAFWPEFRDDKALGQLAGTESLQSPKVREALSKWVEANHNGLRDRLMARMEADRQSIPARADRFGLTASDGAQELQALAADPKGAAHGYMFPTKLMNRHGNGHAETFVVTSAGQVINAIPHPPQGAPQVAGQYNSEVSALMLDERQLSPQETPVGCGTFGISYLKQYLKDDARQLNEGSLLVDCQIAGKAVNFHLPSAQVLKYSQSDLYVKVMRAIVAGEGLTAKVHHKGEDFEVRTLQGLVAAGGSIGRPDGGAMAGGLDAFRAAWLAQFDASQLQRSQMQVDDRNLYLNYTSARLSSRARRGSAPEVGAGPAVVNAIDSTTLRSLR